MISESACLPRSRWKTLLTVLRLTSGGKRDWKSRGSTSPSANSGSNLATNKPHSCLQIELKHRETLKRESSLFFCWLLPRWLRGYSPRQLVRHLWDVPQCRNRPGESGPAKWWVHMSVITHTHTPAHQHTQRSSLIFTYPSDRYKGEISRDTSLWSLPSSGSAPWAGCIHAF